MKYSLLSLLLLASLALADPAQIVKDGVVYDPPAGHEARWVPVGTPPNALVVTKAKILKTRRPAPVTQEGPPTTCRGEDDLVAGPVPPCK